MPSAPLQPLQMPFFEAQISQVTAEVQALERTTEQGMRDLREVTERGMRGLRRVTVTMGVVMSILQVCVIYELHELVRILEWM
jgi:hypothetical protein